MALRYLIDTSVLERLGRLEVRRIVEPLTAAGELGGPVSVISKSAIRRATQQSGTSS